MVKVVIEPNDVEYVVVGSGHGMFKSQGAAGWFVPMNQEGESFKLAVCDYSGRVFWVDSNSVRVVSIDGKTLEEINK